MAIRYSGDVEVRLLHKGGPMFHATVRTPKARWSGDVDSKRALRQVTPDDYDRVALVILCLLEKKNPRAFPCERDGSGAVTLRRVFQAPCPVRSW